MDNKIKYITIIILVVFLVIYIGWLIWTDPLIKESESQIATIQAKLKARKMPITTPVEIRYSKNEYRFWINGKWERL